MRTFFLLLVSCLSISYVVGQSDSTLPHDLRLPSIVLIQDTLITENKQLDIEIDKLFVNETITKAGNDFHELFYSQWTWPEQLKASFIIVIKEKPLLANTTLISILINDVLIFEQPLQPRLDYLESIVGLATMQTTGYLNNYEAIIRSLEGEDIQGSGIF